MADGSYEPDGPSTPPSFSDDVAGDLVEGPGTPPPSQQDERPRTGRTKGGCGSLLLRIAYWSGSGLGVFGALVLLMAAGSIGSHNQSLLEEQARPGFEAQERVTTAQQGLEDLPQRNEAERWLRQTTTVGESIAEVQNTYLAHAGPLPLDDLPTRTPRLGERDECASYLDEIPPSPREYTDEELTDCAEGTREEAIGGLERQLIPHFTARVRDTDGFDPVSQWHSGVPALEEDAPFDDHTWTVHEVYVFEQDLSIPLVWTLTDDTGQMVAWMHGTYDPVVKKFDRMVLGSTEAGGTATDGEDDDVETHDDTVDEDESEGDQE